MNKIDVIDIETNNPRWFVNGAEVSSRVLIEAANQNARMIKRRDQLRSGRYVRPWNSLDPRNEYLRRFGKAAAFPHACRVPFKPFGAT